MTLLGAHGRTALPVPCSPTVKCFCVTRSLLCAQTRALSGLPPRQNMLLRDDVLGKQAHLMRMC